VEVANREEKYPWLSNIPLECVQEKLCEQFPRTKVEVKTARHAFAAILDRYNPRVVIYGGYYQLSFMRAIAKDTVRSGRSSILISDSTRADHIRRTWREYGKRLLVHGIYNGVICAGTRSREYLLELGFDDQKIWNGADAVDNDHFAVGSTEARSAPDTHRERLRLPREYVLCVARHSAEKDIGTLLNACSGLFQKRRNCSLVLCGSGVLTEHLRLKTVQLGIADRVHFVGWVSYHELPYYYALASVTVLPSVSESWGLVVNESLASGTPVIASEICGCVPELIRRGVTGYTFSAGDSAGLESALHKILHFGLGDSALSHCQAMVAPWSIRNRTLGIIDCIRDFGALREVRAKV
jgi:glycosyltransferase involved in cell wall biosynthesis